MTVLPHPDLSEMMAEEDRRFLAQVNAVLRKPARGVVDVRRRTVLRTSDGQVRVHPFIDKHTDLRIPSTSLLIAIHATPEFVAAWNAGEELPPYEYAAIGDFSRLADANFS